MNSTLSSWIRIPKNPFTYQDAVNLCNLRNSRLCTRAEVCTQVFSDNYNRSEAGENWCEFFLVFVY